MSRHEGALRTRIVGVWALSILVLIAAGLAAGPLGPRRELLPPARWFTLPGLLFLAAVMTGLAVLLLIRQSANRIGWLFAGAATMVGTALLVDNYVMASFATGLPPWPGATLVAWMNTWLPVSLWAFITFLLLLFPTGAPASRRWRPLVQVACVFYVLSLVAAALAPGELAGTEVPNPYAWDAAAALLQTVAWVFWPMSAMLNVLAAVSLVARFRGARGLERQQLKWLAVSGLLIVSGATIGLVSGAALGKAGSTLATLGELLAGAGFVSVPVFAALAILRYRLYDLDRILSRTLTYAIVTGMLAVVYGTAVVVMSAVVASLGAGSQVAVAAATLAAAAAFRPVRMRVQHGVDRRFNRRRYDAALTIRAFAERLREPVDVDDVRVDLLATAAGVVDPAIADVWVRPPTPRTP